MTNTIFAAVSLLAIAASSAHVAAQSADTEYDYRARTWQTAFEPGQFFEGYSKDRLYMSISYTGDDWGYPVFAIAVRRGCTDAEKGKARRLCANRLTARMVRAPYEGVPERPRWRGTELFRELDKRKVGTDAELAHAFDDYGLEWMEADVIQCAPAAAHLKNSETTLFFSTPPLFDYTLMLALHADKITFDYNPSHLSKSRFYGMIGEGTPAAWANEFAQSLESCWQPAKAPAPWATLKSGGEG